MTNVGSDVLAVDGGAGAASAGAAVRIDSSSVAGSHSEIDDDDDDDDDDINSGEMESELGDVTASDERVHAGSDDASAGWLRTQRSQCSRLLFVAASSELLPINSTTSLATAFTHRHVTLGKRVTQRSVFVSAYS